MFRVVFFPQLNLLPLGHISLSSGQGLCWIRIRAVFKTDPGKVSVDLVTVGVKGKESLGGKIWGNS